jgi:tRNA threonylcarbamoyladenosine biosynthesis protein TsaE
VNPDDPVTSPTYTILNVHQGRLPLYHFDLYRLDDARQLDDLGFEEYFYGDGVSVVEWAERLYDTNPKDSLFVHFSVDSTDRRVLMFHPEGDRSKELMRLFFTICPYKSV